MRNFFIAVKNAIVRVWLGFRRLVARIFTRPETEGLPMAERLRPIVKYIGSLLVIGLILLGTIFLIKGNDDKDSDDPEIAQVFEPSIGTPLPPDEPGRNGSVSGEVAPTPTPTVVAVAPKTGVDLVEPRVAPKTGIDDDEPVAYKNSELHFAATLPPHTIVTEKSSSITFASKSGWYYTVSTSAAGQETLETIKAQLANSTGVKNLASTKFNGASALQFSSQELGGQAIVFIKDRTIYYLIGNQDYFATFQSI